MHEKGPGVLTKDAGAQSVDGARTSSGDGRADRQRAGEAVLQSGVHPMYYTHGRWLVREGEESAFVAAWDDFAGWAAAAVPGGPWAVLLRDREMPRQFVSFGPWESLEAIADFRSRPQFDAFLATVRPLLETVEVFTLEVAASAGNIPR